VPVKLPYVTPVAFPNPPSTAAASPAQIRQRSLTKVRKFLQHFFSVFTSRECVHGKRLLRNPLLQLNSLNLTSGPPWTCQHSSQVLVPLSSTMEYHQLIAAETCHHSKQCRYIPNSLLYCLRCPFLIRIDMLSTHTWQQSREEFFSQIRWCHMQTISTRQVYKMINIWRQPLRLAILGMYIRSTRSYYLCTSILCYYII
jgi:hypothetical protein